MDALTIILLITVVILIITTRYALIDRLRDMDYRIDELTNLLRQQPRPAEAPKPEAKPVEPVPMQSKNPELPRPEPIRVPVPPTPPVENPVVVEHHSEPIKERVAAINQPVKTWQPQKAEPSRSSFYERYPDMEKFIGENLVNKIGIAILVLAIGFFVKYAIDQNWIGPGGRVGIGIFCGATLVGFAHRFRTNYKAFSSVLAGGGIAIFYLALHWPFSNFTFSAS